MYKLLPTDQITQKPSVFVNRSLDNAFIPFDHTNTDYQRFKIDLTNGAQLHDANNNVMTTEQVTAFVATLP